MQIEAKRAGGRVPWVDYAKGLCIVFVVMMHSTLGVEDAAGREGWLHPLVAFAKPFRMPDFFLISGLFLVFAVGLLGVQRVEMFLRSQRLLSEARATKAAQSA